jgi:hypothetical protein
VHGQLRTGRRRIEVPTYKDMTKRVRHLFAPALILMVLAFPAAAAQASPGAVVRDCAEDGSVDGSYSDADKKAALKQIPADLDEYSDCRSAISGSIGGAKAAKAKKNGSGGGGGGASSSGSGGSGGSSAADTNGDGVVTPTEKKAAKRTEVALKRDDERKATEDTLGARKTDPAKVGAIDASQTSNGLSLPVILAVVALTLLAIAAALLLLGRRKPGFAQALRRVPIPGRPRR